MSTHRHAIASAESRHTTACRGRTVARRAWSARRVLLAFMLAAVPTAFAAAATDSSTPDRNAPEIQRAAATAQADGVAMTLRQIPEACVRLQGAFTGTMPPFQLQVLPTRPECQPRARFLGVQDAPPTGAGWRLNDVIRVPSARCPGLAVVLTVWRKPAEGGSLALDAQGRARIVLADAMHGAVAATTTPQQFVARLGVEGAPCAP